MEHLNKMDDFGVPPFWGNPHIWRVSGRIQDGKSSQHDQVGPLHEACNPSYLYSSMICVCVYLYMCTYIVNVYIYIYIITYIHTLHRYVRTYIHTFMLICAHVTSLSWQIQNRRTKQVHFGNIRCEAQHRHSLSAAKGCHSQQLPDIWEH